MVNKTICYVLGHDQFKTLACSRTDAMVSANQLVVELFTYQPLDIDEFTDLFNLNLPADIRATAIEETHADFNIIQHAKKKHYQYFFSFGQKNHPFSAPFITGLIDYLDIDKMMKGAKLFEGKHNFSNFIYKPKDTTRRERVIDQAYIELNTIYTANFFPEKSYVFHCIGDGFGRHQIRLMMGQLIRLGRNEIDTETLRQSLKSDHMPPFDFLAPPSGLVLNGVEFD